ncbi:MAG: hypothetical protein J0J15_13170, partial [Mesorhizobium sp.]|nr:hypothetical protein [Mesorhizobium sp.]
MLAIAGPVSADGKALLGSIVDAVVTDCPEVPLLTTRTSCLPSTCERYVDSRISSTTTRVRCVAAGA